MFTEEVVWTGWKCIQLDFVVAEFAKIRSVTVLSEFLRIQLPVFAAAIAASVAVMLGTDAEQKCKHYADGCAKVAHHFDGRDQ